MDNELNFPKTSSLPPPPILTMEEYVHFIQSSLRGIVDEKMLEEILRKEKNDSHHLPFHILEDSEDLNA